MRRYFWLYLWLWLCLVACSPPLTVVAAATPPTTVMVPMRDGTLLATDVYLPSGAAPWPVVLTRTPYGKAGALGGFFNGKGMALVVQDTRGRGASQGKARPFFDEGWGDNQDGADTVAWIRAQSWCNGKIATFGPSYTAINQLLLAGAGPEGIVGQHLYFGAGSVYDDAFFWNGVWRKGFIEGYLEQSLWPKDVLPFIQAHPRNDALWATLNFDSRPEQAHWPVVLVGGWFDLFSQGTLNAFTQLQYHGGAGAQGQQHLVIGPWEHGGDHVNMAGELSFPKNAVWPPGAPDVPDWLGLWLTGKSAITPTEPAVRYYVMGDVSDPHAPGNVWRTADRWPPPSQSLRLYFTPEGGLAPQPPASSSTREFDYDPAHPVPSVGDQNGPRDQRRVENRPDVLVFATPPLTEPMEITGRISVRLYATTSASDTDFTAKLTDVYPDGRSMLVSDGIVRAMYRQSVEKADPINPGQQYAYDIDLWSTSLIVNRGHRIRVAISSSNYPRFEKNHNTGESWPYDPSKALVVAHQIVSLGRASASYIALPQIMGASGP